MISRLLITVSVLFLLVVPSVRTGPVTAAEQPPLRLGMIGLDTSHVIAFTRALNDPTRPDYVPGARVVAAFKGGSPDMEASATRLDQFTAELRDKWGVEIVDSIEELCRRSDAVLLMSVDGRRHLNQVQPVFAARKRVFIDKPFAASLRDAREIVRLARAAGVPFFSSSSLRFVPEFQALRKNGQVGELLGVTTWGPLKFEPHHPDLFWYGIHGVEALYALMGPGCESVTRVRGSSGDVITGRWKDGRIGIYRGLKEGAQPYGVTAYGSKAAMTAQPANTDYRGLLVEIVRFFQTGIPPVEPEETLEIIAFMEAAEQSRAQDGKPVSLAQVK